MNQTPADIPTNAQRLSAASSSSKSSSSSTSIDAVAPHAVGVASVTNLAERLAQYLTHLG